MKKVYLSILAIVATLSLVGGATYALFSSKATSGPNTFATGNADLKIAIDTDKDGTKSDWADKVTPWEQYQQNNWQNLYPGWEDSYWVYLKNKSASPITLEVFPKVEITHWSTGALWDKVFLQFFYENGSEATSKANLRWWRDHPQAVNLGEINQGQERGAWVATFSIPTTAGNEITNQNITFDLIFDGIQVTP